ncbi:CCHC-type zinc finger transcription factor [Mucor lusitanicus]|uniref:CCHC-type zinc finger transcription factor n=1 Tax=Mucor lusitanicus CBS 277.49 TaxID=747725 RepID=A0A168NR29_MUCCL|nr:CCHC-type zinc finger transcription factor [Mucor lusitanicus CBS 277.49]
MSNTNTVHRNSSGDSHDAPLLWTHHVVKSRRKGNNQQEQTIVSFNPTILKRPVTEEVSAQQAVNGEAAPSSMDVIHPFLKGVEEDSVFIDLTPIKDRNMLNKALLKFNEASNESGMHEDFLGYRRQPRHYLLHHAFLETMWLYNSDGRKTLIEDGITLEDGTFVKGFASYPADATIVKLTLENLPFLPALQLKKEMAARLSAFGDVLDHGISRTDGIYQREEYATLNLTVPANPYYECQELHPGDVPCPGHRHLEQLSRVIVWDLEATDQRKVLLKWDEMPAFCRNCRSPDHCRADCPDYKKWITCYHCGKKGHVAQNCPRNDSPNKVRAVEKGSPKPRKGANKESKSGSKVATSGPKVTPKESAGGVSGGAKRDPQGDSQAGAPGGAPGGLQGDADSQKNGTKPSGFQGGITGDADSQTGIGQQGGDRDRHVLIVCAT